MNESRKNGKETLEIAEFNQYNWWKMEIMEVKNIDKTSNKSSGYGSGGMSGRSMTIAKQIKKSDDCNKSSNHGCQVGEKCFARRNDDVWCNAVVQTINDEESVKVLYTDYGTVDTVEPRNIVKSRSDIPEPKYYTSKSHIDCHLLAKNKSENLNVADEKIEEKENKNRPSVEDNRPKVNVEPATKSTWEGGKESHKENCLTLPQDDSEVIEKIPGGQYKASLHIASKYFSYLIGTDGQTRKKMEMETRTKIQFPNKGQEGDIVIIGSDRKDVITATKWIYTIMRQWVESKPRQPHRSHQRTDSTKVGLPLMTGMINSFTGGVKTAGGSSEKAMIGTTYGRGCGAGRGLLDLNANFIKAGAYGNMFSQSPDVSKVKMQINETTNSTKSRDCPLSNANVEPSTMQEQEGEKESPKDNILTLPQEGTEKTASSKLKEAENRRANLVMNSKHLNVQPEPTIHADQRKYAPTLNFQKPMKDIISSIETDTNIRKAWVEHLRATSKLSWFSDLALSKSEVSSLKLDQLQSDYIRGKFKEVEWYGTDAYIRKTWTDRLKIPLKKLSFSSIKDLVDNIWNFFENDIYTQQRMEKKRKDDDKNVENGIVGETKTGLTFGRGRGKTFSQSSMVSDVKIGMSGTTKARVGRDRPRSMRGGMTSDRDLVDNAEFGRSSSIGSEVASFVMPPQKIQRNVSQQKSHHDISSFKLKEKNNGGLERNNAHYRKNESEKLQNTDESMSIPSGGSNKAAEEFPSFQDSGHTFNKSELKSDARSLKQDDIYPLQNGIPDEVGNTGYSIVESHSYYFDRIEATPQRIDPRSHWKKPHNTTTSSGMKSVTKAEAITGPHQHRRTTIKDIAKKMTKLDPGYKGLVTFTEGSPSLFWISCDGTGLKCLLDYLEVRYGQGVGDGGGELKEGSWVLSKYSNDGRYFRAKVEDVIVESDDMKESMYMVRYIDYGNCEVVSGDNLKRWDPMLENIPQQAVSCCLKDGPDFWKTTSWSPEQVSVFEKLVDERMDLWADLGSKLTQDNVGDPMFEVVLRLDCVSVVTFLYQNKIIQEMAINAQDGLSLEKTYRPVGGVKSDFNDKSKNVNERESPVLEFNHDNTVFSSKNKLKLKIDLTPSLEPSQSQCNASNPIHGNQTASKLISQREEKMIDEEKMTDGGRMILQKDPMLNKDLQTDENLKNKDGKVIGEEKSTALLYRNMETAPVFDQAQSMNNPDGNGTDSVQDNIQTDNINRNVEDNPCSMPTQQRTHKYTQITEWKSPPQSPPLSPVHPSIHERAVEKVEDWFLNYCSKIPFIHYNVNDY